MPALLRVYPFRLHGSGELGLWEGYSPQPLAAEGAQRFYEDGELTAPLQQTVKFFKAVHEDMAKVHSSLSLLEGAGALTPWEVPGIDSPISQRALTGLFAFCTQGFETLEDTQVLELFRSGALH